MFSQSKLYVNSIAMFIPVTYLNQRKILCIHMEILHFRNLSTEDAKLRVEDGPESEYYLVKVKYLTGADTVMNFRSGAFSLH